MNQLNALSFKQKNIGLAVLVVLMGLVSWHRAIKKTVTMANECQVVEHNIAQANQAQMDRAHLENEKDNLDQVLSMGQDKPSAVQQLLLELVSDYCRQHGVRLEAFPSPQVQTDNEYQVATSQFTVKGSFLELLQLAHTLEKEVTVARLSSVQYYAETNRRTRKKTLYAQFSLQTISKH